MHSQVYRKYGREYGEITSPNITYQYYMPDAEPAEKITEGRWSTVISSCSVTCGSGRRERKQRSHMHVNDTELVNDNTTTCLFMAPILLSFGRYGGAVVSKRVRTCQPTGAFPCKGCMFSLFLCGFRL